MLKKFVLFTVMIALVIVSGVAISAQDDSTTTSTTGYVYNPNYVIIDRRVDYYLLPTTRRVLTFEAPANAAYTIEVTSDDFDPVIEVISLEGLEFADRSGTNVIMDDDDGVTFLNSLISIDPAPVHDTIRLEISSFNGLDGGDFDMIVSLVTTDVSDNVTDTNYGLNIVDVCNPTLSGMWLVGERGEMKQGYIPARIRGEAGLSGTILGYLVGAEPGPYSKFTVLGEEVCRDGYYWVYIGRDDGLRGWVATGRNGDYWADKIN